MVSSLPSNCKKFSRKDKINPYNTRQKALRPLRETQIEKKKNNNKGFRERDLVSNTMVLLIHKSRSRLSFKNLDQQGPIIVQIISKGPVLKYLCDTTYLLHGDVIWIQLSSPLYFKHLESGAIAYSAPWSFPLVLPLHFFYRCLWSQPRWLSSKLMRPHLSIITCNF